ncbi:hypothetical protein B0H11DRAFT_1915862 [Mycena galericulata]|nr:hypothetical protein B0H11DRAFT_1915862 [Mycena galericulata]
MPLKIGEKTAEKYVPRAEHDALCTRVDALEVLNQQMFAAQSLPPGVGQQPVFNGPGQGQGFNPLYNNTPKAQNPTPGQGLWLMQMLPPAGSQGHGQGQLSFFGHGSGSSAGESSRGITPAQTPRAHFQTQTQTQPATPGRSTSFSPKQVRRASFSPKRAIGGPSLPPLRQGTISPAETQRRAPWSPPVHGWHASVSALHTRSQSHPHERATASPVHIHAQALGGGDGGGGSADRRCSGGRGFDRSLPHLSRVQVDSRAHFVQQGLFGVLASFAAVSRKITET